MGVLAPAAAHRAVLRGRRASSPLLEVLGEGSSRLPGLFWLAESSGGSKRPAAGDPCLELHTTAGGSRAAEPHFYQPITFFAVLIQALMHRPSPTPLSSRLLPSHQTALDMPCQFYPHGGLNGLEPQSKPCRDDHQLGLRFAPEDGIPFRRPSRKSPNLGQPVRCPFVRPIRQEICML